MTHKDLDKRRAHGILRLDTRCDQLHGDTSGNKKASSCNTQSH